MEPSATLLLTWAQSLVPFVNLSTHNCWLQTTSSKSSGLCFVNLAPTVCTSWEKEIDEDALKGTQGTKKKKATQIYRILPTCVVTFLTSPAALPSSLSALLSSISLSPLILSDSALLVTLTMTGKSCGIFFQDPLLWRHSYAFRKHFP